MDTRTTTTGQLAEEAAGAVGDAMARAADKMNEAMSTMGQKIDSAADSIRSKLPREGATGEMADAMARSVKHTSHYLQDQGFSGIIDDLETMIRRYPVQALLIGIGIGYLFSRRRRTL